jgi:N-acetylneuraminate synthase
MTPLPLPLRHEPGDRCLVVAEVGQAHDGSLGTAHAHIDAAAEAGADAVKFQTHIAAAESTPGEPWRVRFSPQDETRFDYWRRMEFTEPQWDGLRAHAEDVGLAFASAPFSLEAVELLERVGVSAWKIASGEMGNTPMLERIAAHGAPVLLSSGMSPIEEVDAAVALFSDAQRAVAVLQCTSAYPCPPERIGLNVIAELRARYGCVVGLSDHSGTVFASLAAAALGAGIVELHLTLSRHAFGPDVPASVTVPELAQVVQGLRFIETALANPVDKEAMAEELRDLRDLFTKSVVARADLSAGTVLAPEHLTTKKPGTGIPASQLRALIGRRLTRDVASDQLLAPGDLEPVAEGTPR